MFQGPSWACQVGLCVCGAVNACGGCVPPVAAAGARVTHARGCTHAHTYTHAHAHAQKAIKWIGVYIR